jgi:hypothetical protein
MKIKKEIESNMEAEETRSSEEEEMINDDDNYIESHSNFITLPGFCSECGTILPLPGNKKFVTCYGCKRKWPCEGIC